MWLLSALLCPKTKKSVDRFSEHKMLVFSSVHLLAETVYPSMTIE